METIAKRKKLVKNIKPNDFKFNISWNNAQRLRKVLIYLKTSEESEKDVTLLRYIWNNGKIKSSMQRNQAFRVLTENGEICKNEKGNVYLYFDGHIHSIERTIERKTIE